MLPVSMRCLLACLPACLQIETGNMAGMVSIRDVIHVMLKEHRWAGPGWAGLGGVGGCVGGVGWLPGWVDAWAVDVWVSGCGICTWGWSAGGLAGWLPGFLAGFGASVAGRRQGGQGGSCTRKRPLLCACEGWGGNGLEGPGGAAASASLNLLLALPCTAPARLPACREEVASLQEYIQGTF